MSSAGDVNGDGFDDLLVGAFRADAASNIESDAGDSYVIFGGPSLPSSIDLSVPGSAGVTIYGAESGDRSGRSVSSAGDVNGDGFDDLLVGAFLADAANNAKSAAGDSYVIFGGPSLPTTVDLSAPGFVGVTIYGADSRDQSGSSVSSAGDVNGDGFDDILIGAFMAEAASLGVFHNSGESYVIFGGPSLPPTIDLSALGTDGVTIHGADESDHSGYSVSGAGDVNGDGFDDLLIGAYLADGAGNALTAAGDSYVVFGGPSLPATIDLSAPGGASLTLHGADSSDFSGRSVSSAGDVNGDGFDDLLIGASFAGGASNANSRAGDSYLIFGGPSLPATINLSSLGAAGVTVYGVDGNDFSGRSVSSAGDANGDGFDDLLIGANGADGPGNARTNAGESYLIFGGDFTSSVTHAGTSSSETLTGDSTANVIIGGRGNDELLGNGGADVLRGGEGDDVLAISDLNFARLVGGNGFDTVRLDSGGQTLDLTTLADNRIMGVEQIDISGTGINTLTLDPQEVLNISDESNTLIVRHDNDDTINIGTGWTRVADEVIDGDTFEVYTRGAATLKVQNRPVIDLSLLSASQGSTIYGAQNGDQSGFSVSNAGDVNGDGFDDLLIGAPNADGAGNTRSAAGDSYVVFGGPSLPATIDLSALGAAGVTIYGADGDDQSGISVSSAGDVNGDGFDDLIVGAHLADGASNTRSAAGESYVIFGGNALPTTIDLSALGASGVHIYGADSDDESGISVSSAGDVNGDGFDDLLIGADRADAASNANYAAGESYVLFGGPSLPETIDLSNLGAAGVTIYGADSRDQSGISVSTAGDVNGDGFDDLLIGAYLADSAANSTNAAGDSYVIFGGPSLPTMIDLSALGADGVTIYGADGSDLSGIALSGAGDVNGDGFDDILIGAFAADGAGNAEIDAGESYVIFGGSSLPTTIDLSTLGTAGVTIYGADLGDRSGRSVSGAGDVNGDGFDDLLIGAYLADVVAGESYVIFGGTSLPTTIDLSALAFDGRTILGVGSAEQSGRAVSNAGDVNGDGFDDLLIGAPYANGANNVRNNAGDSYVIFGSDFTSSVTHPGTSAAETLTGDPTANVIVGGQGDDELLGNGGADVLRGGEGDDTLAVGDLNFNRLVGGNGLDTVRLETSGQTLDLTALSDNRILGIEQFDISGTGANTLTLDLQEVLNISDESNTLIVRRDGSDTVNIGSGWTQVANEIIDTVNFEVFTQGAATLKLEVPPRRLTVDTLVDEADGSIVDGDVSLRDAIAAAFAGDTIDFSVAGTIDLVEALGQLTIDTPLSIRGDNQITIDAGGGTDGLIGNGDGFRIFEVNDGLSTAIDVELSGLALTGGDNNDFGGAILAFENVTLDSLNITGNNARFGGGIYVLPGSSTTVLHSTLSNNQSTQNGGAAENSGTLEIHNSTISGNSTTGRGGGVLNVGQSGGAANLTLTNTTLSNNAAGNAGDSIANWDYASSAATSLTNTIVDGSLSIISGSVSGVNSLFSGPAAGVAGSFNLFNTDPQLGPLQNNGGPTETHALLTGSPAINTGDPAAVAGVGDTPEFDQRGAPFSRVLDGRIDIGSFESEPTLINCDFNGDMSCDISDIDLLVSEIAAGTNDPTFDLSGDMQVDLADRDQWLAQAGAMNLPSGNPYLVGDANLDGVVDGQDFIEWNANKFVPTGTWSQADWNADGITDGQDFLLWNTNKFLTADAPSNFNGGDHRLRDIAIGSLFDQEDVEDSSDLRVHVTA